MTTSISFPDLARRAVRGARVRPAGRWPLARPALVAAFWLAVWHVASVAVGEDVLLASPVDVLLRLAELAPTAELWGPVGRTLGRIATGVALGTVLGTVGAVLAATSRVVDALTTPLVSAVRSIPVVSFIVLVLVWADSSSLVVVISVLMVVPVVWTTVREGIDRRDPQLLEAAAVFQVPWWRRVAAIDVPALLPYITAACSIAVGLAWKSGVTAEVIGLPDGSIGEQLQEARSWLRTADLLAWTVVVVVASRASELVVLAGLRRVGGRLASGSIP